MVQRQREARMSVYALIGKWNDGINELVWGMPMLLLLIGTGCWMTVRTGCFQLRYFRYWMSCTLGKIFTDRRVTRHTGDGQTISQFQSLCTALAASLGTGNIVGVSTALFLGGPGAVFWMWAAAFFGMMTKYAENVLGIYFRRKNARGEWCGGAMYYLEYGLGAQRGCAGIGRRLAVLFAAFCILASFGIGNMSQMNAAAQNMEAAFGISPYISGSVLMGAAGLVIIGGMKRIALVAEKIVPVMAVLYIAGSVAVCAVNIEQAPAVWTAIVKGAFGIKAAGGGLAGYGIHAALTWGMKRGVFSNEAGLGSSVMVHAGSNVKEPVQQGMWGIFEVFVDTVVMCSVTAFAVLSSGVMGIPDGSCGLCADGSAAVGAAFGTVFGKAGPAFVAAAILMFAFSTVLGWCHYGTKAFEYLFGERQVHLYRAAFIGMIFWGAVMDLQLAWDLSDTFNGLMALPNLAGILLLSPLVLRITDNYKARRFCGKQVRPMLSAFSDIQEEQEHGKEV